VSQGAPGSVERIAVTVRSCQGIRVTFFYLKNGTCL
jgi:hypothetical protein